MRETKKTAEEPMSEAIQNQLDSITNKNTKSRMWGTIAALLLLTSITIGVIGIYKQNQIALQNQRHIDCIVKLFTTPLPANSRARTISNPSTTCNIQFTK